MSTTPSRFSVRQLAIAGLIGGAYAVLSIFASIFGVAYGPIQCRFSEALTVLPFLFPEATPGLFVGCLIANLLSPYGLLDVVVGSLATLIAALLTQRCRNRLLAPLPPVLLNGVLIGALIAFYEAGFTGAFWGMFLYHGLTVAIAEALVCYGIGLPLLMNLPKIPALKPYLNK